MDAAASCPSGADNQLGPRVDTSCRSFDFTLLFEDGFFVALPAALFLLLLPWRVYLLLKTPVKVDSYKLATWKLGLLALLFVFHLVYLVLLLQIPSLNTSLSLPSGVLAIVAVLAAGVLSFLEDQRSLRPSDILVLYFSASTILSLPRLRSLWLMLSTVAPKATWTTVFVITMTVVVVESIRKTRFLRPLYEGYTTEQTTGFWSRGLFIWVIPFFGVGYRKTLGLDDIPRADSGLEENSAWTKLDATWRNVAGRHRLLRATASANLWPILSAIVPRLAVSCFSFCQPFLIEAAVSNLQAGPDEYRSQYGQALVGAFILVYTGIAVSRALYQRQTNRMLAKIRSGLVSKIYRDTTALRLTDVKDAAAITMMGTNVDRIIESVSQVHELWASVPEIGVATWLLARQISVASILPLIICLVSVVGASRIAAHFGPAQMAWIQRVQERVAVTAKMLSDMKAVKMLGLTDTLFNVTWKLRKDELRASERFRKLLTWQILIGNAPVLFAPFAAFVTYAVIANVKKDETLLTAQAFASISLITLATGPLLRLCEAIPTCMQAVSCFGRIEEYCLTEPVDAPSISRPSSSEDDAQDELEMRHQLRPSLRESLFSFKDAQISWSQGKSENVLRNLTLDITPGFTAIIGPVASGKSTLLAAIIGETILKGGSTTQGLTGVAFCSQTPWITDDTIRRNITGGLDFDEKWYDFTINSCCLQEDLQRLPKGDESDCGSNGASLSGGQRQRVALARAVYSKLPIVILDDVMSGLDSKTTGTLLSRFFSEEGHFRKAGISVIFATHSQRVLPFMDSIVVLDNGRLADFGPYKEVRLRSAALIEQADAEVTPTSDSADETAHVDKPCSPESPQLPTEHAASASSPGQDIKRRRDGSWSVYSYYARSAGTMSVVLWIVFTLIGAIGACSTTIWIEKWTRANEENPNEQLGLYLGIYALLIVLSAAGTAGECWAPIEFFQETDVGSITNRFSQDMDLIDMSLPIHAIQFTTGTATCAVQLIIICVVGKYFAAAVPALIGSLFIVQRYYLRTSRQVRLMDIEAKAPIYKLFIETIQGVSTIRAFGWGSAFHQRHAEALNRSQRPFYMLFCIQQWLALVLDLTVGGLAVVIIASTTAATNTITAGSLGVALVLVLQFSSMLAQSTQAWTRMETSIGAVARVQQYVRDTPSESPGIASIPPEWPSRGAIHFQNVEASYGSHSEPVLNNINLSIAPGERVVLCGSSGSGKSSVIMATLMMMEIRQGRITIDDTDICAFGGRAIRPRLNVVPQEPFFMPGTIRFNIDPGNKSPDASIIAAIHKVGLWDKVESDGGLDGDLDGSEWSHGERQLLCLARAMLVPSKILILDEATSSVDEKTEAMMQGIIDSEFKGWTVISVLHRFNHVHRYDRVVVMLNGELVESGTPKTLLETDSAFRKLYRSQTNGQ
ncbi:Uncharacterized protein TPAR_03195 [Tolypocladium paradoxum]|uniref:ABC transporter n=1 Tax=Tolypocladium paradoxum TaxID=94208 RepID=A0A2S4L2E7_9HYPO|nr:Uncharacterized protein TPAR_03195 [Tolypocladium paradoxum]